MRCPSLSELPPPPAGKTGWPWTEESPQLPDRMPEGSPWPRVSIVTPSYNQAQFIEETIRSVLLQGYPDLEYIIIDGGSTDDSVDIIRKYEPWLAYWVSEPDRGQSHAINKGFERSTGEILAWLNSDDWYLPDILAERADYLVNNPEAVLVYGDCNLVDEAGKLITVWNTGPCTTLDLLLSGNQIPQQSVFMRSTAYFSVGGLNPELQYIMDYELWVRMGVLGKLSYRPGCVANFRHHSVNKSTSDGFRFVLEELACLAEWAHWDHILPKDQFTEVLRRTHIRAALEYIFAGKETKSAEHFEAALQDGAWPYGDINVLAERIAHARGLSLQTIQDSRRMLDSLGRVLSSVRPKRMSSQLWRRIASLYHMRQVFQVESFNQSQAVREHLLKGIRNDPRWLWNRGVWVRLLRHYVLHLI